MKILVDTHIFLWAITDDHRLSAENRTVYLDNSNQLYLSVASVWEMLIKCGLGKLPLPKPASGYILKQMEKNRVEMLTIRAAHLTQLESLPPIHRDPFDRILVAQAMAEDLPLLTSDQYIRQYPVRCIW